MKSFSLIVPIAADKPQYEHELPYVFGLNKAGIMHCVNSILGLNLDAFDKVYFAILSKHEERYKLKDLFALQFSCLGLTKAEVVVLDRPTSSQAETIYKTIKMRNIDGAFFIKDADGYFSGNVEPVNSIAIFPLEDLQFVNPQNKSYVSVDDMFYVTNVIEQRVISHYFNAGGSSFESADDFCKYYETISQYEGRLYVSHIIYSMLLDKRIFRPVVVKEFQDFGNDKLFNYYINSL